MLHTICVHTFTHAPYSAYSDRCNCSPSMTILLSSRSADASDIASSWYARESSAHCFSDRATRPVVCFTTISVAHPMACLSFTLNCRMPSGMGNETQQFCSGERVCKACTEITTQKQRTPEHNAGDPSGATKNSPSASGVLRFPCVHGPRVSRGSWCDTSCTNFRASVRKYIPWPLQQAPSVPHPQQQPRHLLQRQRNL